MTLSLTEAPNLLIAASKLFKIWSMQSTYFIIVLFYIFKN